MWMRERFPNRSLNYFWWFTIIRSVPLSKSFHFVWRFATSSVSLPRSFQEIFLLRFVFTHPCCWHSKASIKLEAFSYSSLVKFDCKIYYSTLLIVLRIQIIAFHLQTQNCQQINEHGAAADEFQYVTSKLLCMGVKNNTPLCRYQATRKLNQGSKCLCSTLPLPQTGINNSRS